ncbi:hypothetical protein DFH94DRAFT_88155 [Russula ochroleuca]|uniref:Uncharacterized protein n=1 Tax=Russula ochroleuca TaxID=152965 RepID=A0A9P5T6X2_9AGAM|nr:hypothetical protein DFH94DRAFT_88155 [Russula ochroleuca]
MTSSNGTNIATKIKQFLRDTFQPLAPPILDYPPPDTQSANHLSPIQPIVIHPPSNLTQSDNQLLRCSHCHPSTVKPHPVSQPLLRCSHCHPPTVKLHPVRQPVTQMLPLSSIHRQTSPSQPTITQIPLSSIHFQISPSHPTITHLPFPFIHHQTSPSQPTVRGPRDPILLQNLQNVQNSLSVMILYLLGRSKLGFESPKMPAETPRSFMNKATSSQLLWSTQRRHNCARENS